MKSDPPMAIEIVVSETITPPRTDERLDFGKVVARMESLTHWDGLLPPPAVLRCTGRRVAIYATGWESWGSCLCLAGHVPPCLFSKTHEVQA